MTTNGLLITPISAKRRAACVVPGCVALAGLTIKVRAHLYPVCSSMHAEHMNCTLTHGHCSKEEATECRS